MTPKQKRAEVVRRWREVEDELLHLTRRRAEFDGEEFHSRRQELVRLRDALEQQLNELYEAEDAGVQEED